MAEKCVVCGYTFTRRDYDEGKGVYTCPYCGTEKQTYSTNEDFERKDLLTQGFNLLAKSNMKEASEKFATYRSKFPQQKDDQLMLGEALAKCGLSTCLDYQEKKLITIVHTTDLSRVLNQTAFNDVIKQKNSIIYENVMEMINSEQTAKVAKDSIVLISLDPAVANDLCHRLINFKHVLDIDITSDNSEIEIYKNIADSSALVVYVDEAKLLTNAYFLSIYNRFRRNKKNVILVVEDFDDVPPMFDDDVKVKYQEPKMVDAIIQGINRSGIGNAESKQEYIMESSNVIEILASNVSLPTNVVQIYPMAGYKKQLNKVATTTTGMLIIGERAFSESTLESFSVQSKNCNLEFGREVFSSCHALKTVSFSNKSVKMSDGTFRDCISLREIALDDLSITEIPTHCFDGCNLLASVKLPKCLKKISKYAFRNTSITEIEIPSSAVVDDSSFHETRIEKVRVLAASSVDFEPSEDMFKPGCRITYVGKELKKAFKLAKKEFGKTFTIEFEK